MKLASLALVATAACTTKTSSLADLQGATLEINAWNDPSGYYQRTHDTGPVGAVVALADPPGCVTLADDVTATLDGQPLVIEDRGGTTTEDGKDYCSAPTFRIDPAPIAAHSELVLQDATSEWRIGVTNLFANDFKLLRVDDPTTIVEWPSAPQPFTAFAAVDNCQDRPKVSGDTFELQLCRAIAALDVEGFGKRQADYCNGPARCTVTVDAGATF